MASLCDGEVIFFGIDAALPVIAEHLAQDKRAVFIRNEQIMLAIGKNEMLLADITTVPLIARNKEQFQLANVLAAVAAAWALDISHDLIRAGIETFDLA